MPNTTHPVDLRQLLERSDRVFPPHPNIAQYFPATSIEDARGRLSRAIERGDGPGLIVGGPGTGKSLLLQLLAAQFHERFDVVLLAAARVCTRRALLQAILFELGLPYHSREEGELRLSLLDHLLSAEKCPAGLLMLVDEAQALPLALLDELRVLTNLIRGGAPRLRLVLAGSAALEESFANPELESFSQRLSSRCYLVPFSRAETIQFIRAQLAAAGGAPDELFAEDAMAAVFDATDGVPRLVNHLCDRALWLAIEQGHLRIERDGVQAAWADVQQLPILWEGPAAGTSTGIVSDIVEFVGLHEDAVVADPLDEEPCDAIEPTDLDVDETPGSIAEDNDGLRDPLDDPAATCQESALVFEDRLQSPEPVTLDPFAEKFDEEEVLLEGLAAWDDMFHRSSPRVENRRDPEFAALVQSAIEAAPAFVRRLESPAFRLMESVSASVAATIEACPPYAFEERPTENWMDYAVDEPTNDGASDGPTNDDNAASIVEQWPALRLAVVSDATCRNHAPTVEPASTPAAMAFDTKTDEPLSPARDWWTQATDYSSAERQASYPLPKTKKSLQKETPVLVVEEDAPAAAPQQSPVRQEDYRHLFSRLRGD